MVKSLSFLSVKNAIIRRPLLAVTAVMLIFGAVTATLWAWQSLWGVADSSGRAAPGIVRTQIGKERPYLGITYVPITTHMMGHYGLASNSGILVTAVAEGSPAERAGVRPDDIITEVNSQKLGYDLTILDALSQHLAGDAFILSVLRGREELRLQATLAPSPGG